MVKNDANLSLQKMHFEFKRHILCLKVNIRRLKFTRKDRPFSKYVVIKDAYLFYLVEGVHGVQL